MKTKHGLLFGFAALFLAAMFSITACGGGDDDTPSAQTSSSFTSVVDLAAWLNTQPENTAETPYSAKLTGFDVTALAAGGDPLGSLFNALSGRYVSIDLSQLNGASIPSPSSDTDIRYGVFNYNRQNSDKLVSVSLPALLTDIGDSAFAGCSSLTSVTLPASITGIGHSAFAGCNSLRFTVTGSGRFSVSDDGKMLLGSSGATLIVYPSATGTVTLPPSVSHIDSYAFAGCDSLTSVTFSEEIQSISIGDYAFAGCSSLYGIESLVGGIGDYAFAGCYSLNGITLLGECRVGDYAFAGCYSLIFTVTGSGSLSVISNGRMLLRSTSITTLIAYPSATGTVTLPDRITEIGPYAFAYSNLSSITLHNYLNFIDDYAFYGCRSLEEVRCYNSNPPGLRSTAFDNTNDDFLIRVGNNDVSRYQTALGWSRYASRISYSPGNY
jgi:hypothetical protein